MNHNDVPTAKTGLSGLFPAKKNHSIVLPESMVVSAEAYWSTRERSSKDGKGQRETGDLPLSPQDLIALARESKVTETEFIEEQKRALKAHKEQKRKRDQQKAKREVKQALGESVTAAERQQSLDEIQDKHGKQESPNLKQSFLDVDRQHLLQSSDSANDHCRIGTEIPESEGVGESIQSKNSYPRARLSHDSQPKLVGEILSEHEHSPSQHQLATPPSSGQPDTTNNHFTEAARNSTPSSSSALHLTVGSRVQMPTQSPIEPFRYGVIRWIGTIPPMQGLVAGIEMVSAECVCIGCTLRCRSVRYFHHWPKVV